MFGHVLKYGLLSLLRTREIVFWTLVFPFALTTFMYFAFGNLFETTEQFHVIPVAVVQEGENEIFAQMLRMVSEEGEDQLLKIHETTREKAEEMLREGEIKGILTAGAKPALQVAESGMDQTLLQMILDQFIQYQKTISEVAQIHPEKIMQAVSALTSQAEYVEEQSSTESSQDNVINYFYAVLAMVCLFASFAGCDRILKIQANVSDLGQRRNMIPVHKLKSILTDFLACEVVQYSIVILLLTYMKFVLRLELGDDLPQILVLLFLGTSYGIMIGIFVGSLPRLGEGAKMGVLVSVSLALSAMSDLMISGIKNSIEHNVPFINDINPAALITDSFYALNIYETDERFWGNMIGLGTGVVVLTLVSYFMVRRSRYASL
jgi:hypothetical protein